MTMNLMGDEDGGVSLYCSECWDEGRPLAYYDAKGENPYRELPTATSIEELAYFARRHDLQVHGR